MKHTERATEARLSDVAASRAGTGESSEETTLRELHQLVSAGIAALHRSLRGDGRLDLDEARAREIKINCLELHARRVLNEPAHPPEGFARHLQVLQVIDAYEVVGNQVYRLTEVVGHDRTALGV